MGARWSQYQNLHAAVQDVTSHTAASVLTQWRTVPQLQSCVCVCGAGSQPHKQQLGNKQQAQMQQARVHAGSPEQQVTIMFACESPVLGHAPLIRGDVQAGRLRAVDTLVKLATRNDAAPLLQGMQQTCQET